MLLRTGASLLNLSVCAVLFSVVVMAHVVPSASAAEPRGTVYKFGATWCGPCQRVAPIVDRLKREGLPIQSVDIDQQPEIASRFKVDRVPTFVLVVDGQEVDRIVGLMTEGELRTMAGHIPATAPPSLVATPAASPARSPLESSLGNPAPIPRPDEQPMQQQPISAPVENGNGAFAGIWPFGPAGEAPPTIRGNDATLGNPEVPANPAAADPMSASIRIRVKMGDNMNLGSGTIVRSTNGYTVIVTCGHIFRDYTTDGKIEVDVFQNGQSKLYLAKLEKFNAAADVGIISIPTDAPLPETPIGKVTAAPKEGDAVACVGCSAGDLPTREQLRVTSIDRYDGPHNIECTGIPVQGRSGGGLFNRDGELVGVCIAADKKGQRGLYAGLFAIHTLLDECGLSALYQPPTSPQAPPANQLVEQNPAGNVLPTQPSPEMLAGASVPTATRTPDRAPVDVAAGGAEVVVIIRDRNQVGGQDRVVIIHEASPTFLKYLQGELAPAATPAMGTSFGAVSPTGATPGTQPLNSAARSSYRAPVETIPPTDRLLRTAHESSIHRSPNLQPTSQQATRYQRSAR